MISMIIAMSLNGCIGNKGKMPWYIPEELQHFKTYTWNKKIVVGRKTFESLKKPLENRYHYVLSHQNCSIEYDNVEIIDKIDYLIDKYRNSQEELVVIGGKQIYLQFLDVIDKIVLTIIKEEYDGDTYFNEFHFDDFSIISKKEYEEFIVYTMIRKEK
ncbi:MAG: dihydrofolate reductase [Traorella sp.]